MARPDEAELLALVNAQAQARTIITTAITTQITAEVRGFTGWYSHPEIREWATRMAKVTRAGQRQTALSTQTYAQRVLAAFLGKRPASARLVDLDGLRGGVPLDAVYGRLADQYRYLRSTGDDDTTRALTDDQVLERVIERAERQVSDNLDLAWQQQFRDEIAAAPATITGYRRIIHPELPAAPGLVPGPACGLCVAAASNTYSRGDLQPIHNLCRCSSLPILGDEGGDGDPGLRLNRRDLDAIYKAAGGTGAAKLKRARFAVTAHGELGPQLTDVTSEAAAEKRRRAVEAKRAGDASRE